MLKTELVTFDSLARNITFSDICLLWLKQPRTYCLSYILDCLIYN